MAARSPTVPKSTAPELCLEAPRPRASPYSRSQHCRRRMIDLAYAGLANPRGLLRQPGEYPTCRAQGSSPGQPVRAVEVDGSARILQHAFFGTSRHFLHNESTLMAPSVRSRVVVQRGGDGQICSGLGDPRRCRSLGWLVSVRPSPYPRSNSSGSSLRHYNFLSASLPRATACGDLVVSCTCAS